jgi:hypothetical protein
MENRWLKQACSYQLPEQLALFTTHNNQNRAEFSRQLARLDQLVGSKKTIRTVAENAGYSVGEERCTFEWGHADTLKSRVISLAPELASKSPKVLVSEEVQYINNAGRGA